MDIKFTITPVNYKELREAYEMCTGKGVNFTAKMIKKNPFGTNTLGYEQHQKDLIFTDERISLVAERLDWIRVRPAPTIAAHQHAEKKKVRRSLDPVWRRESRCGATISNALLGAPKNFFGCKEFVALINLKAATLDEISTSPAYRHASESEEKHVTREPAPTAPRH